MIRNGNKQIWFIYLINKNRFVIGHTKNWNSICNTLHLSHCAMTYFTILHYFTWIGSWNKKRQITMLYKSVIKQVASGCEEKKLFDCKDTNLSWTLFNWIVYFSEYHMELRFTSGNPWPTLVGDRRNDDEVLLTATTSVREPGILRNLDLTLYIVFEPRQVCSRVAHCFNTAI